MTTQLCFPTRCIRGETFLFYHDRPDFALSEGENMIVNESAKILARLIMRSPGMSLSHVVFEFTNTDASAIDVFADQGISFYEAPTAGIDFLRCPISQNAPPAENEEGDGVFTVISSSTALAKEIGGVVEGDFGLEFGGDSRVVAVGLIATGPEGSGLFARRKLSTPVQKLAGLHIGINWKINFDFPHS